MGPGRALAWGVGGDCLLSSPGDVVFALVHTFSREFFLSQRNVALFSTKPPLYFISFFSTRSVAFCRNISGGRQSKPTGSEI